MQKITPFLWFSDNAEEAANYYVSVFANSKIVTTMRYDAASAEASGQAEGSVLTVSFQLDGQDFTALNGGPVYQFSEAISFVVECENQEEIDYYWSKLSAVEEAGQCGWCKDKFGVSWQIVPKNLDELISNPGGMKAMLEMKKLDVAALQKANES